MVFPPNTLQPFLLSDVFSASLIMYLLVHVFNSVYLIKGSFGHFPHELMHMHI